jgi:carboxypeptidase C (cathepsin A)
VESFALGEYWQALSAGATLSAEHKASIAAKLHEYTGLPADYILRSNLRINVGAFAKNLLGGDATAARDDARFSGPAFDPMAREADYDPAAAAFSSAFVSAFNDYVRTSLNFGQGKTYTASLDMDKTWEFLHQPPGEHSKYFAAANVMTDLAAAMKRDPNLKVQLNNGYYDLATPYFSAVYELRHLPIPAALQNNIEMHFYRSGHMIYLNEPELKSLRTNIATFIKANR